MSFGTLDRGAHGRIVSRRSHYAATKALQGWRAPVPPCSLDMLESMGSCRDERAIFCGARNLGCPRVNQSYAPLLRLPWRSRGRKRIAAVQITRRGSTGKRQGRAGRQPCRSARPVLLPSLQLRCGVSAPLLTSSASLPLPWQEGRVVRQPPPSPQPGPHVRLGVCSPSVWPM